MNNRVGTGNFLVRGYDGADTFAQFSASSLQGNLTHIIVTFDGDTVKAYFNGVLQTQYGSAAAGVASDLSRVNLGCYYSGTAGLKAGSIVKAFAFYNKELSQAEATENYNYFDQEGYFP